ncbi:MAG: lipase maturation factor family protein [Myxococcota bacterium]|nr:lipase maturation factor family protein [Myxococcota bacterium]
MIRKSIESASYSWSSWLFIKLLAVAYVCAFVSFGVQIDGLIGSEGILPAEQTMTYVRQNLGQTDWFRFPTLSWWWVSDSALHLHWYAGVVVAFVLLFGWLPHVCLLVLWILYLSLVVVGRDFMAFQWDNLLLETGLLAFFLYSPRLRLRRSSRPNSWVLALFAWLLFRIMFSSGLGKFYTSQDVSWDNLTALTVHFETQPLPTWFGYYWHQLPRGFHSFSCFMVLIAQVFLPFSLFGFQWMRRLGAIFVIGFQLLIAATGNYGFFNLNTIIIAALLVDDSFYSKIAVRLKQLPVLKPINDICVKLGKQDDPIERAQSTTRLFLLGRATWLAVSMVFIFGYFWASMFVMLRTARVQGYNSPATASFLDKIGPLRSINGYGLFVVMTTVRNEIDVQGSNDGKVWKSYRFKYKPGRLDEAPTFMAPHMPRLDWQMWFAALGNVRQNRWFLAFCTQLLQGNKEVLKLLEYNPFPGSPPKFIRAQKDRYRFSDLETKAKTSNWWVRNQNGMYMPMQALP